MSAGILEAISRRLAPHGLIVRGGFTFGPNEQAPDGLNGRPARSVVLIGNGGGRFWPDFEAWRERTGVTEHPLDSWSREIIEHAAEGLSARAVSPSDKPYLPFQQWAVRAEGLRPSPLNILMHPGFGLWHAYRGALLFEDELVFPRQPEPIHLCDGCSAKPCLRRCPVGAHRANGFAYEDCLAHVRGASGHDCRERGCLDRSACPYAVEHRYPAPMQAFLMRAFAGV